MIHAAPKAKAGPDDGAGLSLDDRWHQQFYEQGRYAEMSWRGVPMIKHPLDVPIFAELIHRVMPRVIVETGTRSGGSALFYADMMSIAGVPNPRVVTIDVDENAQVHDERLRFVTGNSVDVQTSDAVHSLAHAGSPRMVILDSDHCADHVLAELIAYSYLVTIGSYLIVEDTNLCGHPVAEHILPDGGPAEGLRRWMEQDRGFVVDRQCERFGVSFNPGGWLRRVR